MRIINKTHWQSHPIKKIAYAVAKSELDPVKRKGYVITIRYGRSRNFIGGRAAYHGKAMTVFLNRYQSPDPVELAHTIAHEFAHSRGMRHRQMRTPRYSLIQGWRDVYDWAKQFPVEASIPKPKTETVTEKKLHHATATLLKWLKKQKLANTKVQRWKKKIVRIEKALAAKRHEVIPTERLKRMIIEEEGH